MATEAEKIEDGGPVDQYVHYSGKVRLTKDLNFEAWSRTLIGFIRHKGLEQELKDWSGGWPCPIGSDPEAPLVYAAAPDLLKVVKEVKRWTSTKCPCHEETPNPCTLCGASVENLEACKAVESVFPRNLLKSVNAAISKAEGRS